MNTRVCLHAKFFLRQHTTSNTQEQLYIGSHDFPYRKLQEVNTVLQKKAHYHQSYFILGTKEKLKTFREHCSMQAAFHLLVGLKCF